MRPHWCWGKGEGREAGECNMGQFPKQSLAGVQMVFSGVPYLCENCPAFVALCCDGGVLQGCLVL